MTPPKDFVCAAIIFKYANSAYLWNCGLEVFKNQSMYQLISDANYYWLHITQPMAAAVSVSAGEESRIDDALNASLTLALQEKNWP